MEQPSTSQIKRALKRLQIFFPGEPYTPESVEELLAKEDVFLGLGAMLQYLQSALLDNKILEVNVDANPRTFFTRLHDAPPERDPEAEEEEGIKKPYRENSYLENLSHVVTLPLEPGVGNFVLRQSKCIILRMFTSLYSVELGTTFQDVILINDVPMLRLNFPAIGRIVRGAREFRAKVPKRLDLQLTILPSRKRKKLDCPIQDVSNHGISFLVGRDGYKLLNIEDAIMVKIFLDGKLLVIIGGTIRHLSKMRAGKSLQFLCGIQLDLENKMLASAIESLVAQVQRAHLQEISQLSEDSGFNLIA